MLIWSLLINILLLLILYKMKKEIFSNKLSKILLLIKNLLYLYRIEKNVMAIGFCNHFFYNFCIFSVL